MPRLPIIEEHKATEEIKNIYATIKDELGFGFVPNLFKSMAINPAVLRGNWENIRLTLLNGLIPRTLKEIICTAISAAKKNNYCLRIHLYRLSILGIDNEVLHGLQESSLDELSIPERDKLIIKFALKVALEPDLVTDKDFNELRDKGLTEGEILEVILTAILVNSLNTYSKLIDINLDTNYV
ncbi:hypothetical protein HRbin37_01433 [bacterium HR37]|nr:hypothetical protein HRbin37_01433 [bacterium HR37]